MMAGVTSALCVKTSAANLRLGPGTGYQVGWTVKKYFPFKKVGVSLSGRWYAVKDIDGDVFWIHKNLVTTRYRCGVISTDGVNIRSGPGIRYRKLFSEPAQKYYSFKILERKGTWVKIMDMDNNVGWVKKRYCRIQ
jgi:SH3-like domain-containing protein